MDDSEFNILLTTNVPDILEKIFLSLNIQSLKNSHQVCKAWNNVLSAESFHKKVNNLIDDYKKLWRASMKGNANKVARILANGNLDVNEPTHEGGPTPLLLAIRWCHKEIVKSLLDSGADPNIADGEGLTPLLEAIVYFPLESAEIAKLLLESGAEVEKEMKRGCARTPLFRAVSFGSSEVVKVLLDYGADPNKEAQDGLTPLSYAYFKMQLYPQNYPGHEYENIYKMLLDAQGKGSVPRNLIIQNCAVL